MLRGEEKAPEATKAEKFNYHAAVKAACKTAGHCPDCTLASLIGMATPCKDHTPLTKAEADAFVAQNVMKGTLPCMFWDNCPCKATCTYGHNWPEIQEACLQKGTSYEYSRAYCGIMLGRANKAFDKFMDEIEPVHVLIPEEEEAYDDFGNTLELMEELAEEEDYDDFVNTLKLMAEQAVEDVVELEELKKLEADEAESKQFMAAAEAFMKTVSCC